jgi:hypothetical protein
MDYNSGGLTPELAIDEIGHLRGIRVWASTSTWVYRRDGSIAVQLGGLVHPLLHTEVCRLHRHGTFSAVWRKRHGHAIRRAQSAPATMMLAIDPEKPGCRRGPPR